MVNTSKNIEINENNETLNKKESNLIYNIEYVSELNDGYFYVISSEFAEITQIGASDQVEMKNVVATINFNNSNPIKIYADNASYNDINSDTNFYGNVLMTYNEHIINSDNLDLMLGKNLATLSNNVVYKNLDTKLEADKVEVDLITKNSKVFMYNSSNTVKLVNIN